MFSVIIAAHDHAAVIERCLRSILDGAEPGELEVIVVAHGCHDDTAALARAFGEPVRVIELPRSSKAEALNRGDEHAQSFPRMYVDPEIVVGIEALRKVAGLLGEDSPTLAAAPEPDFDYSGRSPLVRSFYKVWSSLPYFTENLVGAGFYAMSRRGRERFGKFPELVGEDAFVRLTVGPHERRSARGTFFRITPPRGLRGVIERMTKVRAGKAEVHAKFPELLGNETTRPRRSLRIIAERPDLWVHAPVYLGVMGLATLGARLRRGGRGERTG
ncbi:MAG: glycosyltransferase [Myxococcales bacterium]|nr:glycosyltransferase [Myxococcales bacterium]